MKTLSFTICCSFCFTNSCYVCILYSDNSHSTTHGKYLHSCEIRSRFWNVKPKLIVSLLHKFYACSDKIVCYLVSLLGLRLVLDHYDWLCVRCMCGWHVYMRNIVNKVVENEMRKWWVGGAGAIWSVLQLNNNTHAHTHIATSLAFMIDA